MSNYGSVDAPKPGDQFRVKHWTRKVLEIRAVLVHSRDESQIPLNGYRDSWLVVATDGTKWSVRELDDGTIRWRGEPLAKEE